MSADRPTPAAMFDAADWRVSLGPETFEQHQVSERIRIQRERAERDRVRAVQRRIVAQREVRQLEDLLELARRRLEELPPTPSTMFD